MESRELLERLRRGDEEAFNTIFRSLYAPLVRFAEGIVGVRAIAEELVQDVLLELWRRRETLAAESSPQAYLYQSIRNRAFNHLRHERVARRAEPEVKTEPARDAPGPAVLVEEEIDVALRRAMSELPARTREVFELSRINGLKYAEIARTLEISVKTVEAHMGKALRTLREKLAQWLPAGDLL